MTIAARILRLLALAIWLGGIVFFGAVVAPGAARIFGTTEQFATFIGHSILTLHMLGIYCGIAMLVALRFLNNRAYKPLWQGGVILAMLVLTFVSNRAIILPMEHDRQLAGGNISIMMQGSPIREDFDARHKWSTKVEGTVLFLGIGLAALIGCEAGLRERITTAPPRRVYDLDDE